MLVRRGVRSSRVTLAIATRGSAAARLSPVSWAGVVAAAPAPAASRAAEQTAYRGEVHLQPTVAISPRPAPFPLQTETAAETRWLSPKRPLTCLATSGHPRVCSGASRPRTRAGGSAGSCPEEMCLGALACVLARVRVLSSDRGLLRRVLSEAIAAVVVRDESAVATGAMAGRGVRRAVSCRP